METLQSKVAEAEHASDDWYEYGFARVEGSRRRGVVSMPLPHAQTLLKWAGYVPGSDLSNMLVIDPACGSGNTLLAAVQALAARGRVRRWGAERLAQEIEHSIWGLDPDPIACNVAELRLRRLIAHLVPDLASSRRKAMMLHIHQTDSLVLPADARFQLVVTNPPLVTARGVVISYSGFESKTPPRDVWLRFLEQSMRLVAYGGCLAIALPEALLTKAAAGSVRAELQTEWTLEHLAHLTGVFRSGPATVMLLLRRQPPTESATVQWERIERLSLPGRRDGAAAAEHLPVTIHSRGVRAERRHQGTLQQAQLAPHPHGPWRYALAEPERAFVERMAKPNGTIGRSFLHEILTITRGAELVKDSPEPATSRFPGSVALLRGIDVEPFRPQPGRAWLAPGAFKGSLDQWRGPKLVLPRGGAATQVALDTSGAVPLVTLYSLMPPHASTSIETLHWLLALLNSRPLRAYLALTQTAYVLARPAIELDALRMLPIALGSSEVQQRLAGLASELQHHRMTYGNSPEDALQYPISQRLETALNLEVNALYQLSATDAEIVERWG